MDNYQEIMIELDLLEATLVNTASALVEEEINNAVINKQIEELLEEFEKLKEVFHTFMRKGEPDVELGVEAGEEEASQPDPNVSGKKKEE